ncbi:MAG: type IV pilin protein [Acinetobacter sp.]
MVNQSTNGFTLVELMIVVVIIGILAAFAYPSYIQYKIRTQRTDAQSEMMFVAQRMQAYKATNGTFQNATVSLLYGGTTTPKQGVALYDLSFSPSPTGATSWVLIATPRTGTQQVSNGVICLNDQGQKFWAKGAATCSLSPTSTWDGR